MKKIIIMTLAVMVFGTVSFAKGNGAEDKNKSAEKVEAVDLGLSVKWANMLALLRVMERRIRINLQKKWKL